MIKKYKEYIKEYIKESLLDKLKGPPIEEVVNNNPDELLKIGIVENNIEYVKLALENNANPFVNNYHLFLYDGKDKEIIIDLLFKYSKLPKSVDEFVKILFNNIEPENDDNGVVKYKNKYGVLFSLNNYLELEAQIYYLFRNIYGKTTKQILSLFITHFNLNEFKTINILLLSSFKLQKLLYDNSNGLNESLLDKLKGPTEEEFLNSIKNISVEKAFDVSIRNNSLDGVKTIFESGRYISFSNKSYAMTIAQMYKYYDIIDYLNNIQGIKINAEFAAGKGDIKLLEIIKNKKQHLNILHCLKEAAKYGEIESIKFLLNNYDVNDIDLKITIEATTNLYGLNNKLISDDEKEEIVKYILDNYELSLYQLDSLFYYTQERNAYGIRNIIEKKIKEISEIKLKNN